MVDVFVKERKEEVFLIRYRGAIVETSGSIISEAKSAVRKSSARADHSFGSSQVAVLPVCYQSLIERALSHNPRKSVQWRMGAWFRS
jgi:hypothetical protein